MWQSMAKGWKLGVSVTLRCVNVHDPGPEQVPRFKTWRQTSMNWYEISLRETYGMAIVIRNNVSLFLISYSLIMRIFTPASVMLGKMEPLHGLKVDRSLICLFLYSTILGYNNSVFHCYCLLLLNCCFLFCMRCIIHYYYYYYGVIGQ